MGKLSSISMCKFNILFSYAPLFFVHLHNETKLNNKIIPSSNLDADGERETTMQLIVTLYQSTTKINQYINHLNVVHVTDEWQVCMPYSLKFSSGEYFRQSFRHQLLVMNFLPLSFVLCN